MKLLSILALAVLAAGCEGNSGKGAPPDRFAPMKQVQAKYAVRQARVSAADLGRDPQLQFSTVEGPHFHVWLKAVNTQLDPRLDGTYAHVDHRGDLSSGGSNYADSVTLTLRTEDQKRIWDIELAKYFKPRDVLPGEAK